MRKLSLTNTFPDMVTLTDSAIVCSAKVFAAFRDFFEAVHFNVGETLRSTSTPDAELRTVVEIRPDGYLCKTIFDCGDRVVIGFEESKDWHVIRVGR